MEEDIKILKELLSSNEPVCNYKLKHQEIEAISNILNRLEQLEKENERLEQNNQEMQKEAFVNSIPKSVIKEKIEELEEEKLCFYSDYAIEERNNKIELLKELLGEEKC